jgi:FlaA1/EpsC-like NDP-sugar epimerase
MIRLAGRTLRDASNPTGDIEITFTGLRPGEKLYEELLITSSNAQATQHPKIMRGDEPFIGSSALQKILTELQQLLANHQADAAKQLLLQVALDTPTPTRPNIA